jgi:hypothetical protein
VVKAIEWRDSFQDGIITRDSGDVKHFRCLREFYGSCDLALSGRPGFPLDRHQGMHEPIPAGQLNLREHMKGLNDVSRELGKDDRQGAEV